LAATKGKVAGAARPAEFIPINRPLLGEEEKRAVVSVLESGALTDSSFEGGRFVREFEGKVKRLLGVKHAVAVNSGTAALHASLMALGVKEGDEVIVPSMTFVATANVVLACGAKPVFVDIKRDYNLDPKAVGRAVSKRTKAIIPVHLYGYPADMDEIVEVAGKNSLRIVEDAAESLGAEYRGRQTGSIGDVGCFSMYASKVATSGEGGVISTNDDELAEVLREVRSHGMVHGYDSRRLGFNYRLPEIPAAIASVQMDRLPSFLAARRRNANLLTRLVTGPDAEFTQDSGDRTHVFYLFTLLLGKNRDRVKRRLNEKGIGASVYFATPVHETPLYAKLGYSRKRLPFTEEASKRVLSLPVHPGVTPGQLERVAEEFLEAKALAV